MSDEVFPNALAAPTNDGFLSTRGMTKREMFAAMAMQGILANPVYDPPRRNLLAGMAQDAVSAADALIAELAKATTP